MTVVWTMYGLELYQKYHPFKGYGWYLVVLSSVLALGGAGFLLYCRKKRKVYIVHKGGRMRGEWICRDEDALIYWMYMALYLFWEGVAIYVLITLSHQMINGLPLKV